MTLKRIDAVSVGKVLAVLYGLLGLIIGLVVTLVSIMGSAVGAAASGSNEAWFGLLFGAGAIVALPIFYAVVGFIGGLIMSTLYNVASSWVGGIEVELE